jgi:HK97 gp10 family phage protein
LKVKFSVVSKLNTAKVQLKTQAGTTKRLERAGLLVEREAKKLVAKGGGRASPPQVKGETYYYGDPKNKWVRASKEGRPPNVQTGDLRNSIRTERAGLFAVIVGPSVFYGKFLECGTRLMAARPFMRPALAKAKKELPQLFKGLL